MVIRDRHKLLAKKFHINLMPIPELDTTNVSGVRHYITEKGNYPSVTTVLGATGNKEFLEQWKERIGSEKAAGITSRAASRGTALHNLCEDYLLNTEPHYDTTSSMPINRELFKQIKKVLDENVDNVFMIESPLVSDKLKIAGRSDLGAEWNNELAIIDYKTSSKKKMKEWIKDYFLQASLYAYMYYEMTGILVKKIVIIIAIEEENEAQVFVDIPRNYIEEAIERVEKYYENIS